MYSRRSQRVSLRRPVAIVVVLFVLLTVASYNFLPTKENFSSGDFRLPVEIDNWADRLVKDKDRLGTVDFTEKEKKDKEDILKEETSKKDEKEFDDVVKTDHEKDRTANSSKIVIPEHLHRAKAIRDAFQHAWFGYKSHAWGFDELKPRSQKGSNMLALGMTIVDSLDTLWLMDMKEEFWEAKTWIEQNLNFDRGIDVSVFETNIRILGGLLSAYAFSKSTVFLTKAEDLANRLLKAFDTPSGIPMASINLQSGRARSPGWTGGNSILSEMGTMQLEFKYLAHVTGKRVYHDKVQKVMDILDNNAVNKGLYPIYVSPTSGHFSGNQITYGALGDSFYEYLIKQWYQTGKTEKQFRRMYDECMVGLFDHLLKESSPSKLVYIAESNGAHEIHKMDHLACFAAGMLALGAKGSADEERHMKAARGIADTCYEMYKRQPSGVGPESVVFREGYDCVAQAKYYILRPEAVEAQFYLWRYTHDEKYREQAWEMWEAIDKNCRCDVGYAGLRDVTSAKPAQDDLMQSFFLAETLKYLFLTFIDDSAIDLEKYVFNTEAHPLPIWNPGEN